ncbi:MAG: YdcH family protein [Methyloceanibacter sp.]|uniref:YdcH family protein n=1 Tax=Methyloceanibacter sp. TaxID=1965321 RepID=UPI003D9B1F90
MMGDRRPLKWRSDMALDAHLVELSERHRALDRKIEEELARPQADALKIAEWKRLKLRLKDEIERLKHELSH